VELSVLVLVLVAALLHAVWNALVKVGGDPLVRLAVVAGSSSLVAALFLGFVEPPPTACWPYLAASVLLHQAYYGLLARAYREGDLSTVYPIARGLAPVGVAVGAWVLAGERLEIVGVAGIATVGAGIVGLVGRCEWRCCGGRPALAALFTSFAIAGYSVVDGIGVRASGEVWSYVVYQGVLQGIPIAATVGFLRRGTLRVDLARHGSRGLVAGGLAVCAYGISLWAMSRAPLGYVAALREVGVVLAALIGTRLFGEPGGRRRVAAALTVVVGIALMRSTL